MIKLYQSYTSGQAVVVSKLNELQAMLKMVSFTIDGVVEDVCELSRYAAIEGMKIIAQGVEDNWMIRKEELLKNHPSFDFEKRYMVVIYNSPLGKLISFDDFVGFDYRDEPVNVNIYTNGELAYALLEPLYGIKLSTEAKVGSDEYITEKVREFTEIYRLFLNEYLLFSQFNEEDFIIYSWSDDWSNFFDAGQDWWGTFYWTVYNKKNNTIIVLGASESD